MGANALEPYSLNDPALDSLFSDGEFDRKIRCYNVSNLARYKFKNEIFIEMGPMLGLLSKKSRDEFFIQPYTVKRTFHMKTKYWTT